MFALQVTGQQTAHLRQRMLMLRTLAEQLRLPWHLVLLVGKRLWAVAAAPVALLT
jgi:hypothetical protein